uniref:Cytochrome c oxidase subunit 2 n=1 Tax=Xibalbanus tulumensis TaxID=1519145 RepID=Q6SKZ0_XIBTU|nr:cytochrome c oxidase subunit II [Xibalbanus tulumensis]AAS00883.1 cytochrome c oxidase subunit 2 [Xibalbanus tulumensis]
MMTWAQMSFQNSASPVMEEMIFLHDHIMLIILMILSMIMYLMMTIIMNKSSTTKITENQQLEFLWTSIPAITLLFIATPSMMVLYLSDEPMSPQITLKTIGHQWYWSYEYPDFKDLEFDSYMMQSEDLKKGMMRLLEVDNRTTIPMNTQTRVLITSADVIHSWTIPSMAIKTDAIPGRLNQTNMMINRPGLFFGQCSEICGANHSFMPIVIEATTMKNFLNWVKTNK